MTSILNAPAPTRPRRRMLLIAAALIAAATLGYLDGALSFDHAQSSHVSVDGDIAGTVQTVSSDGDAISIRLTNRHILNTAVVNVGRFPLRSGETVTATLLEISAADSSPVQQPALILSAR